MRKSLLFLSILFLFALSTHFAFAQSDDAGTLEFRANGEDFVREGFVTKDGWRVDFEHVFVSLTHIRAHQTTPPYDPFAGELVSSNVMVGVPGILTVDLAEGEADAEPILIGTFEDAPAGFYNALGWIMMPAEEGEIAGQTVVMDGTAVRDGEEIDFIIRLDGTYQYTCGSFVGDERKGIVSAGETSDIELTFHFDHIFGDAEAPVDDTLNVEAPGFDVFAEIAQDGVVDVTQSDLEMQLSEDDYAMLLNVMPSLGHVGEGHCHES